MRGGRRTACAFVMILGGAIGAIASKAAAEIVESPLPRSEDAMEMAAWVSATGDNRGLPFIIIDKLAAEVLVFDAEGQLRGATPALLGLARGDDSVPGIGDRALSAIRPDERTTPAGRFMAGYGPAKGKAKVLWVDYATAISLHPVVTGNPKERRLKRLSSPSPQDNRITYGCINVSTAFYQAVVHKTFSGSRGVVYVLPETRTLQAVFPGYQMQARTSPSTIGLAAAHTGAALSSADAGAAGTDAAEVR